MEKDFSRPAQKQVTRKLKIDEPVRQSRKSIEKTKSVVRKQSIKKTVKTDDKKAASVIVTGNFKSLNFDSILDLSDRKIKEMVKKVDLMTLTYATKGAHQAVREKIEKNLGKLALKKYHEFLDQIKTIKTAEVTKYRKKIEQEIKSLF
ncbi:MAG: hypothetical protein NTX61_08590 [Bacteroidetes bacterium]|nr:hypothetical protein [Bacteroidota bacterium]